MDSPILTLIRLEAAAHSGAFSLAAGCVLLALIVARRPARRARDADTAGVVPTNDPRRVDPGEK